MKDICGLILAAGQGKRIGASEKGIPKVMFPVKSQPSKGGSPVGRPMIRYAVDHIKFAGINDIILVVGFEKQQIIDYFKDEVQYAVQEEQKGTGHAVMMAKDLIVNNYQAVCVCYGDHILYKPETIKKLIDLYQQEKPSEGGSPSGRPTIAMLTGIVDDPSRFGFGRIVRNERGEITANVEQKDCTPEQLAIKEFNPCFFIFDATWLYENLPKLSTDNAQGEYYLTDMIAIAVDQGKKISSTLVEDWHEVMGINNLEHLSEAESYL
jgi:bifunctional UDP-N-acetylglucosamine pyrophosphorylase/glucosamine-1-phosphate N-acetyltransferase